MNRIINVFLFLIFLSCGASKKAQVDAADTNVPDIQEIAEPGEMPAEIEEIETGKWKEPPASVTMGEGKFKVEIKSNPIEVSLKNGEDYMVKGGGFAYGEVSEKTENAYYDPYEPFMPVTFIKAVRIAKYCVDGKKYKFLIELEGSDFANLEAEELAAGRFAFRLIPENKGKKVFSRFIFGSDQDENYYGLGEYFDSVSHKGKRRAMQFRLSELESSNNEAHVPVPFFVSTRSWGLFVEDRNPASFDMASEDKNSLRIDFESLDTAFYLFAADKPIDVLEHYVKISGQPAVPAYWAFAPMYWRNENSSQQEVLDDAKTMRDLKIAGSTIWIDNPWQHAYNDHIFNTKVFPDAKAMIKTLNDLGFRVGVWSTPYLEEKVGDAYEKAVKNDYFVKMYDAPWFLKFGYLLDLTNPEAVELFKGLIKNATDIGIEGFKLDYGEDVQIGMLGTLLGWKFYNKETALTMHHWFQIFFHKPYFDMLGNEKGWLLNRAGTYGDQTVTPIIWPGDLDSDFRVFGDEGHVGGLPSAVNGGLTLSTSGYPFYGSDTGGFRHDRPVKEVMIRWSEYSAFGTIMQVGGGGKNHWAWDFTNYCECQSHYDQETLDIFKFFASMHLRLFPYIYTYAKHAQTSGRCVTCPFGFVFPSEKKHPDSIFTLGDNMLVAPVVNDKFTKEVIIPAGKWIDFWTDEIVDGPAVISKDVPLDTIPVYVPSGAIIPMLAPEIVTLAPATGPDIASYANDPGKLWVEIYPAGPAGESNPVTTSFVVYAGPEISSQFSGSLIIKVVDQGTFKGFRLRIHWGAIPSQPSAPQTVLSQKSIALAKKASADDLKSCDHCCFYDEAEKILEISLPSGNEILTISP